MAKTGELGGECFEVIGKDMTSSPKVLGNAWES
jgi:hypothetical protein